MKSLSFYALGTPVGQPRPRSCKRGKRSGVYNPRTADEWKAAVAAAAKAAWDGRQFTGPIRLSITAWMSRPKSHFRADGQLKPGAPRWHVSKPDRDNVEKAVMDAITNAGIWTDDSLVCDGPVRKLYANGQPGAEVRIEEIVE